MRLWTLHPKYLDRQGLLALWREALLAQAVLLNKTKGYRNHPQLERFRNQPDSVAAIATYLKEIHSEGKRRGFRFDGRKIHRRKTKKQMIETDGQLLYEWQHLKAKLKNRSPWLFSKYKEEKQPLPHPIFRIVSGNVRRWEKRKNEVGTKKRL